MIASVEWVDFYRKKSYFSVDVNTQLSIPFGNRVDAIQGQLGNAIPSTSFQWITSVCLSFLLPALPTRSFLLLIIVRLDSVHAL